MAQLSNLKQIEAVSSDGIFGVAVVSPNEFYVAYFDSHSHLNIKHYTCSNSNTYS